MPMISTDAPARMHAWLERIPLGRPCRLLILVSLPLLALSGGAVAIDRRLGLVPVILLAVLFLLAVPLQHLVVTMTLLVPVQGFFYVPGTQITFRLAYVLGVVIVLRALIGKRDRGASLQNTHRLPFALFFLSLLLSSWGAADRYLAGKAILDWSSLMITFCAVVFTVKEGRQIRVLVLALMAGWVFEGAAGLFQFWGGGAAQRIMLETPGISALIYQPNALSEKLVANDPNWVFMGRVLPFGTFLNAIDFAIFMAMGLSFVAGLLGGGSSAARRPVLVAVAVLLSLSVVLAAKGTGWSAAAAGLTVTWLVGRPKPSRALLALLPIAAAAAVVPVLGSENVLVERMYELLGLSGSSSLLGRWNIWQHYLAVANDAWLLGHGPYNHILYGFLARTWQGGGPTTISFTPENGYLALYVDMGVIGMIALAVMAGSLLIPGLKATGSGYSGEKGALRRASLGAAITFLVGNATVTGLTQYQNLMAFAIFTGLLCVSSRLSSRIDFSKVATT